ncbi:MAG TPA: tRNA pseudouridine(38-40) synthase TruA [bacterium]|nr:tRNA pseudouridine(38-40) synthase TruA [bacterium]
MPSDEKKIMMVVAYDGSGFHGFQRQPEGLRTVQAELEKAVLGLTGVPSEVFGASRTDAGVHATGQTTHFATSSHIPADRMGRALRRFLPDDISIMNSESAPPEFHARHSARGKVYVYTIDRSPEPIPMSAKFAAHIGAPLDEKKMERAAELLVGTNDYSAFRNEGSSPADPVKTIRAIKISRYGPFMSITVTGTAFLYKMARNLAGTIVEAGRGRIDPEDMPGIIESKDRRLAGPTMPARGLCLVKVFYE